MNLAGMASNRGRNLMHIAEMAPGGSELSVVLSNDAGAPVLEKARDRDVPTETVVRDADESRRTHEGRILDALESYDIDLVCLDGYMRILSDTFLDAMPTTLNVHPSLLPAFPGTDAWGDALDAGVRVTGCTVHVVTDATDEIAEVIESEVDAGPIVTQEPVPVYEDDDRETLKRRVLHQGEFRAYPRAVGWFARGQVDVDFAAGSVTVEGDTGGDRTDAGSRFPQRRFASDDHASGLRYGENPHQDAAVYGDYGCAESSVVAADRLDSGGKGLSYNNYNDADAALGLIREFDRPAAAVIKHANPAGCAVADSPADAYERALSTDPMSAFGGIVVLNRPCDRPTAEAITGSYKEVVVAPGYDDTALDVLLSQDDLRVLDVGELDDRTDRLTESRLVGGRLVQERDFGSLSPDDLEIVTQREPTDAELETMLFAWRTVKHVKSNAIVLADGTETVGVGAGQMSRVDAVDLAARKARDHARDKGPEGSVMASDAFFPFPDGVERAGEAGVDAVIQPGGSINDYESIAMADEYDLAMAFTDQRAFRH